jgi:D-alanyl-D-alanine carboxypeptidase
MRVFRPAALAVVPLALAIVFAAPTVARAHPCSPALCAALQKDIDAFLAARTGPEHISTVSLSISLHSGAPNINLTTGATEYGGRQPVRPLDLFQIGSNTKAFTGVIMLRLEAERRLSIDDTIGKWLPQYPAWSKIKIRQLLNMTSGTATYDNTIAWAKAVASDPFMDFSAAQLIAFTYPTARPPGTGYEYSNTGYIFAQLVIAAASPMHSYEAELARLIADAGLRHTSYEPNRYPAPILDQLVSGYYENHGTTPADIALYPLLGKDAKRWSVSWAQAAGAIVSTPEDITHWARSLYESNLLPQQQRAELFSLVSTKTGKSIPTTTPKDPEGFGLGVIQMDNPTAGKVWFYQGTTLGYRMLHIFVPASGLVLAIGVNSQPSDSENGLGKLTDAILNTLHKFGVGSHV